MNSLRRWLPSKREEDKPWAQRYPHWVARRSQLGQCIARQRTNIVEWKIKRTAGGAAVGGITNSRMEKKGPADKVMSE